MGVLGCCFCGHQIRYHGEPEGDVPIEHIFCRLDKWQELEKLDLTADWLECDHEEKFIYAWRCERCGSFSFFSDYVHVSGVYVPTDNFSTEPMKEPFEFGLFWDDILWFEITESNTLASEVLTKFPGNLWLAKNDDELRFYKDQNRTECVSQFKRFERPAKVTVQSMSIPAFKKMLLNYNDEIDFFYHGVSYEFIKEVLIDSRVKIIVNRDFDLQIRVYENIFDANEDFTNELIHAKIFQDGKSILEVPNEVDL